MNLPGLVKRSATSFRTASIALHLLLQFGSGAVLIGYLEARSRRDAMAAEQTAFDREASVLSLLARTADPKLLASVPGVSFSKSGCSATEPFRMGHGRRAVSRCATIELRNGQTATLRRDMRRPFDWGTLSAAVLGAVLLAIDAAVATAFIQGRIMDARIRRLTQVTNEVSQGMLDRRVERRFNGDIFDRLGAALNQTFSAIERSVGEMRALTDMIAHDLRSPMMRVRVRVEELIRGSTEPERLSAADRLLDEVDAMVAMLGTALEISRAEAGVARSQFSLLDVSAIAEDLGEVYRSVAESAAIEFTTEIQPGVVMIGHEQLVAALITNLIENALKHGGTGGQVRLSVSFDGDEIEIIVGDNGQGISPEDRTKALSRFGRLDAARSGRGAGLGLSLVDAVCRLHGGTVALMDGNPGLVVRVALSARGNARD